MSGVNRAQNKASSLAGGWPRVQTGVRVKALGLAQCAQAARAERHLDNATIQRHRRFLQVRPPHPVRAPLGMANIMAELGGLAAHFTLGHSLTSF